MTERSLTADLYRGSLTLSDVADALLSAVRELDRAWPSPDWTGAGAEAAGAAARELTTSGEAAAARLYDVAALARAVASAVTFDR